MCSPYSVECVGKSKGGKVMESCSSLVNKKVSVLNLFFKY